MYQPACFASSLFLVYPFLPHALSQACALTFALRVAFVHCSHALSLHCIAKRVASKLATHSNMQLQAFACFAQHSQRAPRSTSAQACDLSRMWQKWLKKAYPLQQAG